MSAVLNTRTRAVSAPQARPSLVLVQGMSLSQARAANPKVALVIMMVLGAALISFLGLLLSIATSQGVYQVSSLKAQKADLDLKSQILAQQVDSLSSNQNLANAAKAMGMVSNANPVFLDVASAKVYGSPTKALNSATSRVSGNLLANAQLTAKTSAAAIAKAQAAEQARANAKTVAVSKVAAAHKTKGTGSSALGAIDGSQSGGAAVGGSVIPVAVTH